MDTNIRRLLKEIGAEDLIEVFAPCMDDYLYIIDLQKNTLIISQAAVKRFKMPGNSFDNAADSVCYFVYEEDRPMIREHLQRIADGNEKITICITDGLIKMGCRYGLTAVER